MIGTKLIAATVAGAAFGAGTLALVPSHAASDESSARHGKAKHLAIQQARNVIHGTWVTRNGKRHEAIRGVVSSVSASSITVRASDGYTQTYQINDDTKVRVLRDGDKKADDSISEVKSGYRAVVVGTGTDTATRIVAAKPKAAASS